MEHRLITGGHEFLPFARSCVAKLKKLGLPYADQSYEVNGVSIKVRIEPGHEYIKIEGGQKWYSIFPRSLQHRGGITTVTDENGVVTTVTPYAKARPHNAAQLHKHYQTGSHDWVSFDGYADDDTVKYGKRLITFSGDAVGRYPLAMGAGPYDCWTELQNIIINGMHAKFTRVVSGIAIKDVVSVEGVKTSYVVYASASHLPNSTADLEFYSVPLSEVFTAGHTDTKIGSTINVPGYIRQPIFFDGLGAGFASVLTTYLHDSTTTTSTLKGKISADAKSVSCFTTIFDTSPHESRSETAFGIDSNGTPIGDTNFGSSYTSNSSACALVGMDMAIDGTRELAAVFDYYGDSHNYSSSIHFMGTDSRSRVYGVKLMFDGIEMYRSAAEDGSYFANGSDLDTDTTQYWSGQAQLTIYDADMRHLVAIGTVYKYRYSYTQVYVSDVIVSSSVDSSLVLFAKVGTDSKSKTIKTTPGVHKLLHERDTKSKMFASREKDNYMVCAHVPAAIHEGDPGYPISIFDGVDISPLAFCRKGEKVTDMDFDKYGLGVDDTGKRCTPITLVYSDSSMKAP